MYDEWINPECKKREKRLVKWIIRLFLFVFLVGIMSLFLSGCTCDPTKPKVQFRPFVNQPEIVLKGYDGDCDGTLDYWQHYKYGKPFSTKIWIEDDRI